MAKKQYFKLNFTPTPKPDGGGNNIQENSGGGRMSITLGKAPVPNRIRNQHEGIKIIDHGSSSDGGGGFLAKRFGRK